MCIATAYSGGQLRQTNAFVPGSQAWRSAAAPLLYLRTALRGLHQAGVCDAMRGAGTGGSIERLARADADSAARLWPSVEASRQLGQPSPLYRPEIQKELPW